MYIIIYIYIHNISYIYIYMYLHIYIYMDTEPHSFLPKIGVFPWFSMFQKSSHGDQVIDLDRLSALGHPGGLDRICVTFC